MIVTVSNVKAINKGALVQKFDVTFQEIGLTVRECLLFQKGSNRWITFPSRQYEDKEGKIKYYQYARFNDEKTLIEAQRYIIEKLDNHEIGPDNGATNRDDLLNKEPLPF